SSLHARERLARLGEVRESGLQALRQIAVANRVKYAIFARRRDELFQAHRIGRLAERRLAAAIAGDDGGGPAPAEDLHAVGVVRVQACLRLRRRRDVAARRAAFVLVGEDDEGEQRVLADEGRRSTERVLAVVDAGGDG